MTGHAHIVLEGRFDASHIKRYFHLPFDVPAGVRQLHVRYSYNDQIDSDPLITGGNTLDIGIFDERGIAPGSPGYRGWSGSEKLEFTIDAEWATPPYRAAAPVAAAGRGWMGPRRPALPHAVFRRRLLAERDAPRRRRGGTRVPRGHRPQQRRAPRRVRRRRRDAPDRRPGRRGHDLSRPLERLGHRPLVRVPRADSRPRLAGDARGRERRRVHLGLPPEAVRTAVGVRGRARLSGDRGAE